MSISSDLLIYFKQQRNEVKLHQFLDVKGYSNPLDDTFGLNQWTSLLSPRASYTNEEKNDNIIHRPNHLVSFLAIPGLWDEEIVDTNSPELRKWVSDYKWLDIPGLYPPFSSAKVRACSEGLLLPERVPGSEKQELNIFLLIRRDGIVECGLGQDAYHYMNKQYVAFQFIQIVGLFWQYLAFLGVLYAKFFPNLIEETLILVNMRGTQEALLGDLAEGWNQPDPRGLCSYNPKCSDKHIQIQKKVKPSMLVKDMEDIIRWFATRIDNAWGQFEPRCYVNRDKDESQPFARRKPM